MRLTVVPAETIAVHTFTGDRGRDAVQAHTAVLLDALNGTVFEPSGAPQAWFYDPPWTIPLFRRNEIVVAVNRR
nr:SOUL heme-binding protein [Mycolicibacter nonchromogenicus]